MVSPKEEPLVDNIRLSTVGPGQVTGADTVHHPTNLDLATKLHYLRAVYYFTSQAVDGLTTMKIKEPMFTWYNHFYMTCGRFRRSESGRPYIKCNDSGARFVEAQCEKTLEEWLDMEDGGDCEKLLTFNQTVGPELPFSPLVFTQFTNFKCGGMSVGLSWAHALGDAFSAVDFMNMLAQIMAHNNPARPKPKASSSPSTPSRDPLSLKRVDPVGDKWIYSNSCKMETFSLHVTPTQLSHVQAKVSGNSNKSPPFESLCALIWQSIAQIRGVPQAKIVTICKRSNEKKRVLSNNQVISTVTIDRSVTDVDLAELAALIKDEAVDERAQIEETVENDENGSDFILYGANLTFVDLGNDALYDFKIKGEAPVRVNYMMEGVGENGVVFVLPAGPTESDKDDRGRILILTLPKDEVSMLKSELKREWSIA